MKKPQKLNDVLGFKPMLNHFYSYTDHRTQLQYLLSGKEITEDGFKAHLFGYQYRVCLNFKEIYDADGRYEKLYLQLNGRGVTSIDEALKELDLLPLHTAIENIFSGINLEKFREHLLYKEAKSKNDKSNFYLELLPAYKNLSDQIKEFTEIKFSSKKSEERFQSDLIAAREFYQMLIKYSDRKNVTKWMLRTNSLLPVNSKPAVDQELATLLIVLIIKYSFALPIKKDELGKYFDELLFYKPISRILESFSANGNVHTKIELIKVLLEFHYQSIRKLKSAARIKDIKSSNIEEKQSNLVTNLNVLLDSKIVYNLLHVNEFDGITYFNKENFEELLRWLLLFMILKLKEDKNIGDEKSFLKQIKNFISETDSIIIEAEKSSYDLNKLKGKILKAGKTHKSTDKKIRGKTVVKKTTKQRTKNKKR
jgi:hypothetical protein